MSRVHAMYARQYVRRVYAILKANYNIYSFILAERPTTFCPPRLKLLRVIQERFRVRHRSISDKHELLPTIIGLFDN